MKKRILASLMSLCLIIGLLPTAALATGTEPADGGTLPTACTKNAACTLADGHEGDCKIAPAEPEESEPTEPVCAELAGCVDSSHDPDCPLFVDSTNSSEPPSSTEPEPAIAGAERSVISSAPVVRNGEVTDTVEWKYDSETATLTVTGTGAMADYENQMAQPWYGIAEQIEKIVVGEGITKIGQHAFSNILPDEIVLPASLTEIGDWGLQGAKKYIVTGTNFVVDEHGALYSADKKILYAYPGNTGSIDEYSVDDATETVAPGAFSSAQIKKLNFGENVTSIGAWQSGTMTEVYIAPGVKELELVRGSFSNFNQLEKITLNRVRNMVGGAGLNNRPNLTEVIFDEQMESLPWQAFSGNPHLFETLEFPDSLTTIGEQAFQAGTSDKDPTLKRVVYGAGITSVDKSAFEWQNEIKFIDLTRATPENLKPEWGEQGEPYTDFQNTYRGSRATEVSFYLPSVDYLVAKAELEEFAGPDSSSHYYFIFNGGTATNYPEDKSMPTPEKPGSIFEGWYSYTYEGNDYTNGTIDGKKVETRGDVKSVYYAKWAGMDDLSLQYGGTGKLSATKGLELSNYQSNNNDVATVDSSGNVTATGVGTAIISATGTYNGKSETFKATVTVSPRVLTYSTKDTPPQENPGSVSYPVSDEHTNVSSILTFKWKDDSTKEVTLTDGTEIDYTYMVPTDDGGVGQEGTVDFLPMAVGEYDDVKFNLKNPNYTFARTDDGTTNTLTIDVNVTVKNATRAYISALITETAFTYDGTGKLPAAGPLTAYTAPSTDAETVDIGTFTIHIEGLNETVFEETVADIEAGTEITEVVGLNLPTRPGVYIVTVSAANGSYYVYKSQVFSISKATVTIKADDKTAYVGDAMPELTYTVTGLVGNDTLTTAPTLTCNVADTDTAGTYTIRARGAVADAEFYALKYENGTLTISRHSSGGEGGTSSGSTTYAITVESSRHGEVDSNRTRASSGTAVTLTVTPDEGYVLDELTVTDKDGDAVKVTNKGNGKYTFTMPRSAVTVEASFVPEADPDIPAFMDVPADAYYADAVAWAVSEGITTGTSATTFSPDMSCTRAQMVTFLWRAAGSPAPTTGNNPFTDVQSGSYYYDAVLWAVEQGITSGTSATTFSPDATVSRGQTVTFLWRQAGAPVVNYAMSFTDVPADAYYAEAVRWAVSEVITSGTGAATFSPDNACTRGQIVTFLYRANA